jgi:hypothetical protein
MKKVIIHEKRLIKPGIVIIICLFLTSFTQPYKNRTNPVKDGMVPDGITAIKIAEAIWLPIYGTEIYNYKPFKAKLINGKIWRVDGTVHTDFGGSPIAEIQKKDCKVLLVTHEK